jgi:hypothetical protein
VPAGAGRDSQGVHGKAEGDSGGFPCLQRGADLSAPSLKKALGTLRLKREVLIHISGRLEDVLAKAVRAEKALHYLQGGDRTKEKAFIVDRQAQDKKETPFQQQLREMKEMIEALQQEVKGLRGGMSTQGGRPSLQSGRSGQYPPMEALEGQERA